MCLFSYARQRGVESHLVVVFRSLLYFAAVVVPSCCDCVNMYNKWDTPHISIFSDKRKQLKVKYNMWRFVITTAYLWWLDTHSSFYPSRDFLPTSFGFVLWLPFRALGAAYRFVSWSNDNTTLPTDAALDKSVPVLDTDDASLLYSPTEQSESIWAYTVSSWASLFLYFGLWILLVGIQSFAILLCIKKYTANQINVTKGNKPLFVRLGIYVIFLACLSLNTDIVMELLYLCAVLFTVGCYIACIRTRRNRALMTFCWGVALLYQHLDPARDFTSDGYATPEKGGAEESASVPLLWGMNAIISEWICVFVLTICICRVGGQELGSCSLKHAACLVPIFLLFYVTYWGYLEHMSKWEPFESAVAVLAFCAVMVLCLVWPLPATLWDQRGSLALRVSSAALALRMVYHVPDVPLMVWAASIAFGLAMTWANDWRLTSSTKTNALAFAATSPVIHVVNESGPPPKLNRDGTLRFVTGFYELIPAEDSGGHSPAYWCRDTDMMIYLWGSRWAIAGGKSVGGSLCHYPSALAWTDRSWLRDPTTWNGVRWENKQGVVLNVRVLTSLQIVQERTSLGQAPATALLQKHEGDLCDTFEFFHERKAVLDALEGVSEDEATRLLELYQNSKKAIPAHHDLIALQSLGLSTSDAHEVLSSSRPSFWSYFLSERLSSNKTKNQKSESKRHGATVADHAVPQQPLLARQQSAKTAFLSWVGIAEVRYRGCVLMEYVEYTAHRSDMWWW